MKYICCTLFLVVFYGLLLVSFAKRNNPTHTHVQEELQKEIRTTGLGGTRVGTWPNHKQNKGVWVNGGVHPTGSWGGSGGWPRNHNGVGPNGKGEELQKEIHTRGWGGTPVGTWPNPKQNNGVRVNVVGRGGWGGSGGWPHHNGVGPNAKGDGN